MTHFADFIPYVAALLAIVTFNNRAQQAGNSLQSSLTFAASGGVAFLVGAWFGNWIVYWYFLGSTPFGILPPPATVIDAWLPICDPVRVSSLAKTLLTAPGCLLGIGLAMLAWNRQFGLENRFIRPPPDYSKFGAVAAGHGPSEGSFVNDPKVRAVVTQIVVIGAVATLFYFIVANTAHNLERLGIASGFKFLCDPARYDVTGGFMPVSSTETHWAAFTAGLLNTFVVAVFGCIAATILGVIIGVLRLSNNWIVNKLAAVYVEVLRNIPVLLQILFWYGIFILLPAPRQSNSLFDTFYLNNRGLLGPKLFIGDAPALSEEKQAAMIQEMGDVKYQRLVEAAGGEENVPAALAQAVRPVFGTGSWVLFASIIVAIVAVWFYRRWARKRQEATGQQSPVFLVSAGTIILFPILCLLVSGTTLEIQHTELKGFNFVGGTSISVSFIALWFALSVYTAAFIAEIVRAGILAVPYGQTEASYALGLRPGQAMRLNILPQALRVIVPPLTSQYLNLTKNSSLAQVVGFLEIVGTIGGITLNQTGQAVECIVITMAVYLIISLVISVFMNWYNKRISLVER